MSKTKKLDIFNLFYSSAAVVILIGVIAKLLEWPAQDILITVGLGIEAIVFAVSAIRFIEIKKDNEMATEVTLLKMAESLSLMAEGLAYLSNGKSVAQLHNSTDNFDHGSQSQNYAENATNLIEKMDVLKLTKDMFYHPSWVSLNKEEYAQLTDLFKKLFDKKLPSKDVLPHLNTFPVTFINTLQILTAKKITSKDLEILWKSLIIAEAYYFFETVILEESASEIIIRPKNDTEIQIFGGESPEVITHVKQFHNSNLIVSPAKPFLQDSIYLKDDHLIEYIIEHSDIINEQEVASISNLIILKSDETKTMFWNRFNKIVYDAKSGEGYLLLKAIALSAVNFQNIENGSNLLLDKLEIITDSNIKITRKDVINFPDEDIYFGNDNEFHIKLSELFFNGELGNRKYFDNVIEQLSRDEISNKVALYQLFNLINNDSVEDLLRILKYQLAKTNSSAKGEQLTFVLLCKIFINS
jgi:hypothetical protein